MYIRKYDSLDCKYLAQLFYDTVHTINARDYTEEQLNVWADGNVDLAEWNRTLLEHHTVVAIEADEIAGFGDMDKKGYLDRLYIHKNYQNQGIATALCDYLEQSSLAAQITTHASITAKPFFEKRGYKIVKQQQVVRKGILLTNYVMEKGI